MINIEVIKSPDINVMADFKFFQNQIYIGNDAENLCIADVGLLATHIMLEVVENELLIHPMKNVKFYLINGKRCSVVKKLSPNDKITIAETTFKILSFQETTKDSKKKILNAKLDELLEKKSLRLLSIESLTKRMK